MLGAVPFERPEDGDTLSRPLMGESALRFAARQAMGGWLAELAPWTLFPTFTYDVRRLPGASTASPGNVSRWKAMRDLEQFLKEAYGALRRPVDGIIALETHENGSYHAHGLLAPARGLQEGDIATVGQVWFRRHGYFKCVRIEGPKTAEEKAVYCSKYMSKDAGDLVLSRGLVRHLKLERRFGR